MKSCETCMLNRTSTNKNKSGPAQVGGPFKFQKTKFLKYAKDNIVKILSLSVPKRPQGIRIELENHFPQLETKNLYHQMELRHTIGKISK